MSIQFIEEKFYINEISEGNEEAFEVIYNHYSGMVARVSYHVTGNAEEARDITQKVFLELNRKANTLTDHTSLSGWLYTTARNMSKAHVRSATRQQEREKNYNDLDSQQSDVVDYKSLQIIEDEIQLLPEEHKQIIVQHYYEGLSQKEIAIGLDINASTLRNWMKKAKDTLEEKLRVKEICILGVFLSSLETNAQNSTGINLPSAAESFNLINKSGGILMKTIMSTALVAGLVAAAILNFAGAGEVKNGNAGSVAEVTAKPAEIKQLTQAHNKFGFKLLKELHKEGENTFISPTSINTAFGMAHNGTVNAVKHEFEQVFGWSDFNSNTFNSANSELMKGLQSKDKKSILEIANSIWIRDSFKVENAFIKENMQFFDASVNNVPFNQQTIKRINDWADEKTHGKITEIIKELKPLEVMVLVNAVYFKGAWTDAFEKGSTYPQDFYLADKSKVKVPLMYKQSSMDYLETDDFQAVRLPFGKGETAMTFILPKNDLSDFQKNLTDKEFQSIQMKFSKKEISLFLPRFKIEYGTLLNTPLKNMGLKKPFGFSDGFAKINAIEQLRISKVIHKTFLEVKEEGAEAAAVTASKFEMASARLTPAMKINRPFLCAITNTKTGNVVFVGTIYNPLK
jgi:RNA polymerase sigma factor (sigma-70 family)